MAAATARCVFRSSSFRNAASKVATEVKASRNPFRVTNQKPRLPRAPVEMSCCVESLLPLHSATASCRMISMLSLSGRSWLCEAGKDDA